LEKYIREEKENGIKEKIIKNSKIYIKKENIL
jgi:hypothetical protein